MVRKASHKNRCTFEAGDRGALKREVIETLIPYSSDRWISFPGRSSSWVVARSSIGEATA